MNHASDLRLVEFFKRTLLFAAPISLLCAACLAADATPPPDATKMSGACPAAADQPLAFWFGRWDVFADGKLDGHSHIESTLQGCTVLEHWDDVSGLQGMSVFYFEPHIRQWKQVWITDRAFAPGGLKEKVMISSTSELARFQGSVWIAPDRMILDRTTLRKLEGGKVSQVIEYSKDGGTTWTKSYDAIYRHVAGEHSEE